MQPVTALAAVQRTSHISPRQRAGLCFWWPWSAGGSQGQCKNTKTCTGPVQHTLHCRSPLPPTHDKLLSFLHLPSSLPNSTPQTSLNTSSTRHRSHRTMSNKPSAKAIARLNATTLFPEIKKGRLSFSFSPILTLELLEVLERLICHIPNLGPIRCCSLSFSNHSVLLFF